MQARNDFRTGETPESEHYALAHGVLQDIQNKHLGEGSHMLAARSSIEIKLGRKYVEFVDQAQAHNPYINL